VAIAVTAYFGEKHCSWPINHPYPAPRQPGGGLSEAGVVLFPASLKALWQGFKRKSAALRPNRFRWEHRPFAVRILLCMTYGELDRRPVLLPGKGHMGNVG